MEGTMGQIDWAFVTGMIKECVDAYAFNVITTAEYHDAMEEISRLLDEAWKGEKE
jgi:hypothetical protein